MLLKRKILENKMHKTKEELMVIADELIEEGYKFSEAYPIFRWRKLGWPEDEEVFKIIDHFIKASYLYQEYLKK
jgi:hypothetical protein